MLQYSNKLIKLCLLKQNRNLRFFTSQSGSDPKCPETSVVNWENALPFKKIPGPKSYPVIGIAYAFMPGGKFHNLSVYEMHRKLREEYGDLILLRGLLGKPNIVMCFDPDDMKMIYRTEGQLPVRKTLESFTYFRKNLRPDIFNETGGLLAEQGDLWQAMRTKVNPVMLQPKTVRLYVKPVDDVAKDFVARIKLIRDNKNEVPNDFGNEMNKWALESIGCIALNARLGVLTNLDKNSDGQRFIEAVHNFFTLTFELDILPSIWRYYKTSKFVKMMTTLDTLTNLTLKYIDDAIIQFETNKDPTRELSVVEKLLKMDRNTAVIMALDMLMAGVDTTSANFMAKNPDKQEKLRQEIIEKLPNKDSELTPDDIKNMPYMRACLKESNRMMPPASGNLRSAGQDLVLHGYQVPKDTYLVMGHMLIQNDERFFKKSKEFIPERWLKNVETDVVESSANTHPFVYMPFGFGPRSCIGRRFAELELDIIIIRILRNFRIEWHYPEIKYTGKLVNSPGGDLKFRFNDL